LKKGKQVIITIDPEGDVQIAAYCLTTDSWQDYLAFRDEAREAFQRGDKRRGNRNLRAALLSLFSHVEGVLNNICEQIKVSEKIKNGPLHSRICFIGNEAKKHNNIPDINFRLGKYMRDIIAHPGIDKAFEGGERVDEVSVYEKLTPESLTEIAATLDNWLSAVCHALKIERFTDTEKIVKDLGAELGTVTNSGEI
jgi:hypothetical protein